MSDRVSETTTAWLGTTASQIFFMQLGFLCYEVGYVKPIWTRSIILKNTEDTFVGMIIFLAFGYTLSESPNSFYGIISVPTNPLLIGVSNAIHDRILISAFFASTLATILSGAVLERMKNKVYIVWCSLIVLINYSFVAHWVWHNDGWLSKLGFVDGAGAITVHSTAGMAALVSVWRLGPRNGSLDTNGRLLPIDRAARPIINVMGAFFLWFGWFAFNISSPIAWTKGIGDAVGTTALVTVVSPVCSALGAFTWMYLGFLDLSYEELMSCLLAGLVAITGPCHNCNVLESAVIGFVSSIVYYIMAYIVRNKWHLDDPLQVITIHCFCGLFSGIAEGVVANDVYGSVGLIFGGYRHFGVQILGVTVISIFNLIMCIILYDLMRLCLFRGVNMKVSVLDIYLGTRVYDQDYDIALHAVLKCNSNIARKMLWQFHEYIANRFASEQLDFLIVVSVLNNYRLTNNGAIDDIKMAKYVLQIIETYVTVDGDRCINVSGTERNILLKIQRRIMLDLKENEDIEHDHSHEEKQEQKQKHIQSKSYTEPEWMNDVFRVPFYTIWKIIMPHFCQFLRIEFKPRIGKKRMERKFPVKIPFTLKDDWVLQWDDTIIKETESMELVDTVPQNVNDGTLLMTYDAIQKKHSQREDNDHESHIQIQLSDIQQSAYPVIFTDIQGIGGAKVIIE